MKYKEITINTNTQASELVADILSDLGSKGVGIYDTSDIANIYNQQIIWDYIDENLLLNNEVVAVKGYFEKEIFEDTIINLAQRLEFLKENCPFEYGSLEVISKDVDDEDWVNVWKQHYKPINAGKVTIVPNWIDYTAKENEVIVRMDPGMAFGTGEHESTKMCLLLMDEIGVKGKHVVDIGTGSGILGIAAVKLGAKSVEAYDIDDVAVIAAMSNAKVNGVEGNFKVENANLLDKTSSKFDIVLANITSDVLIGLSNDLKNYMFKGSVAIISGIIKQRAEEVKNVYINAGYKVIDSRAMGEWVAFLLEV